MKEKVRVCHITTVHARNDIRIFKKECVTLGLAGYEVFLVVADGLGDEIIDGVNIIDALGGIKKDQAQASNADIYNPGNRFKRMTVNAQLAYNTALLVNANIYHFHDPELISCGLKLKRAGKTVIYDAHEDVAKQVLSKPYLNKIVAVALSFAIGIYELFATRKYDAVIAVTESIGARLEKMAKRIYIIHNYPFIEEFLPVVSGSRKNVCYMGSLTQIRGALEMVLAAEHTKCRLILAGDFVSQEFADKLHRQPGWKNIDYRGLVGREALAKIMETCFAGLIVFSDEPNHREALPNKIFEYMSAGLPVIGSRFPLWVKLIEGNGCGICLDQTDPKSLADAINYLDANREVATDMGRKGRAVIEQYYNWENEKGILIDLYQTLLNNSARGGANGGR